MRARATRPAMVGLLAIGGACDHVEAGCAADLNASGDVDVMDVLILLADRWGAGPGDSADFNGDGLVDGQDLGYMLASFGGCGGDPPLPVPAKTTLVIVDASDAEALAAGLREYEVYAEFDDGADTVINVYDVNVEITGAPSWTHTDIKQTWIPNPDFAVGPCSCDSFFTIGAEPAFGSPIAFDPNLVDDTDAPTLGVNAGWFDSIPTSPSGVAGDYPDHRVLLLRLVQPETAVSEGSLSLLYRADDGALYSATESLVVPAAGNPADLDGSGTVDGADLGILLAAWGACSGCPEDLDDDGFVDGADLGLLLAAWEI